MVVSPSVNALYCVGCLVLKCLVMPFVPLLAFQANKCLHTEQTVQMTSSRVRLGQSFKMVGYGCTSCWGDVEAGDVEADVFYISFIVSVQYIGY